MKNKILALFLIIVGFILLIFTFNYEEKIQEDYTSKNTSTYKVSIKENPFISEEYLDGERNYVAKMVDNIDINFKYYLKNNKEKDNYKYNIKVILKSTTLENDNTLWQKDYLIKNETFKNNSTLNILEDVKIDYNYYYNLVQNFASYYNLNIKASLYVRLDIYNKDETNNFIEYKIPLNKTFSITKNEGENIKTKKQKNNPKIYFLNGISIIFLVGGFLIILTKSRFLFKIHKNFLKENEGLIITCLNKPDFNNLEILYLQDLNDLIKIATQHNTNILYYEKTSMYYIIQDKLAFIYFHLT